MTTVQTDTWQALRDHAEELGPMMSLPMVWPKESAPAKGAYLWVQHFPNVSTRFSINSNGASRRPGLLQISVMRPLSAKEDVAVSVEQAGKVADHFKQDTKLYSGSVRVNIPKQPDVSTGFRDQASWHTPVSISYEVLI